MKLKIIDLFAGIGGIRLGFKSKIDIECVFSSEWDKNAQKVYEDNFGEKTFGDINNIPPNEIPNHDILLAGFPCQAFSIAGKQLGFADTRGTLFFNIQEIIKAKRPKVFLLENVKRLKTHDHGNTFKIIKTKLEELGYIVYDRILNSLDFGVPQKRERIFIIGFNPKLEFKFPEPRGFYSPLKNILEDNVSDKYFASDEIKRKRLEKVKGTPEVPSIWHENIGGNISALPYSCALRAGGSYNYLLVNGERRLTGREMLRLQGFKDSFIMNVPYTQIRKLVGNSVTVPVIEHLATNIIDALKKNKKPSIVEQLEIPYNEK
tara:strand:+ start:415 stop:1371 length:957 start_codon:yes stop_codon:yes gene_type:complete